MAKEKSNAQHFFYIIIGIVFCGLVFLGIMLIIQSNKIYNQSYEITKNVIETPYNKAIAIPAPNYGSIKDGYGQALSFFMLAIGALLLVLLLPRLQTFSLSPTGGITVTLKDLQQNVDSLIKQANSIQASSTGEGGIKTLSEGQVIENLQVLLNDDPQKGKWGKMSERNERKLSAIVEKTINANYNVTITLESTNNLKFPLKGLVKFHLHPTFKNPNPVIAVLDGKAVLTLSKVWGPFTVGAEADDGDTFLELDLAELKDTPEEFKKGKK